MTPKSPQYLIAVISSSQYSPAQSVRQCEVRSELREFLEFQNQHKSPKLRPKAFLLFVRQLQLAV